MAMQVAALSVSAGAGAMALASSEAKAEDATSVTAAGASLGSEALAGGPEPVRVTGWSCMAPVSRGPLAPPGQSGEDFEALLAEVPA